ncbi:MAG: pyridoxamine 5'-phosphate oxidase family protein [Acidobacteria bacterium]|nr:pyridoxamine 5'-phosphate oxidase family protein [Acidobacteriota bacterium]MCH8265986.1 pyridoxamine 5'-phosphate oxidase family protein [Acidobacteriota bacterium]MCZ6753257.1 pyridoxamine 5'-phosphate oxidase family protein [Acidobacteriota bacterium]
MSKRLEPKLPDRLFDLLNGENLSPNLNKVIVLVTVDGKGWPYAAILSYLEVLAPDRTNIRLAPWSNSTTTANIRSNGKVTLLVVDENMAYYVQGTGTELSRDMEGFPGMSKVNVRIESVLEDKALDYEGSARITTGIRFENPQMDAAYIERGRRVLAGLRRESEGQS